jgi:hypothetical protein
MKVVATQRGTKGAAEDQTLTFRRELSQVSLHRVDEHRRQSDDAHPGRRLRRASDPPPVSELGELSRDPDRSRIQV